MLSHGGPGGGSGGAYGTSQGVRDLLGSLLASVTVQPPAAQEQLTILSQTHPLLAPLLPAALATLRLISLAAGQATPDKDAIEVCPCLLPFSLLKTLWVLMTVSNQSSLCPEQFYNVHQWPAGAK